MTTIIVIIIIIIIMIIIIMRWIIIIIMIIIIQIKRKNEKVENGKRGRKKDRVKSKTSNILALVDRIERSEEHTSELQSRP